MLTKEKDQITAERVLAPQGQEHSQCVKRSWCCSHLKHSRGWMNRLLWGHGAHGIAFRSAELL